ncbi:MAG TPA: hypothetical protein PK788_14770 [Gemmatimonadaceae bacterium]|nr:hypothetical protein [Gemmatimonadaceae bacterium]
MHFDANTYLDALDPPKLTIGSETFTGRFLSVDEYARVAEKMGRYGEGKMGWEEQKRMFKELCDLIFPPVNPYPDVPWWKRLFSPPPVAPGSVYEKLERLPYPVMVAAITSFTNSLARGLSDAAVVALREKVEGEETKATA